MGRLPEPVALLEAKGRSHMGGEEREARRRRELRVPFTDIKAPTYLTKRQATKFDNIASMLLALGIMTELDTDCLGRYICAHDLYIGYTKVLRKLMSSGDVDELQKAQGLQSKAFQQAQAAARDLGLTVTSRCRIQVPPPPDPEEDDL